MKKNQQNYPYYEVEKIISIKDMMEKAVNEAGDKLAFRYKKGNDVVDVTYKQFQQETFALGSALNKLGFSNRHIACLGENSYNWLTVYLTVLKSSGVFVPIDKELPFCDIINVVNDSDSEILFYSAKYEKDLMENVERFPKIKYFIGFDRETDEKNFLSFEEFRENGANLYADGYNEYVNETSDPMALKLLVYTSGTTGMAKGVMLSENNLVCCMYYGLRISTVYDSCLSVLPYNHTYEAVAGILVSLLHHSTICINDNLKNVLKNLQLFKPEYLYVVPAFAELFYKKIWSTAEQTGKAGLMRKMIKMANALNLSRGARRRLFSSIHQSFGGNLIKIVCGGAPVRAELGDFFDSIGIDLINGYGITECSPLVSANRDRFNDCATVGVPLECLEIKLENLTADGDGEICVKGPTVMMGYYKNPALTAEVIHDGYFNTGDYGRINEKGQLIINGRKKNLIVLSNGKNVFPEEIENYILAIPYVKEVVVYGIKDASGQENGLCAEVYLNADTVKEKKITDPYASLKRDVAEVTSHLPSYKRVSEIKVRAEEFPKTTTNKIKRASVVAGY